MRPAIKPWVGRLLDRVRGRQNVATLKTLGASVGNRVRLAQPTWIDPGFAWLITIGDDAILGPGVSVIAHDASTKRLTGYTLIRPVSIGRRVYVGASAVILPGVTVGDDAVIGAATVVRNDVPPGALVVGNPARVVGQVADHRERHLSALAERPVFDESAATLLASPDARKQEIREAVREGPGYVR